MKVSIFYACHNMGPCNIWDSLNKNIIFAKDKQKELPEEVCTFCINTIWEETRIEICLSVCWVVEKPVCFAAYFIIIYYFIQHINENKKSRMHGWAWSFILIFLLQATKYCISSCFFGVLWELHQIEDMNEKRALTHDAVDALRSRLHLFMEACKHLLAQSNNPIFREEVSQSISAT